MVSAETLISCPDWKLPLKFHTDASDKKLGAVISQNNKPIAFFYRKLIKPYCNCTETEKKILAILERLNKLRGVIFGFEINILSYHRNLVYASTLSKSQRVMRW